MTSVSLLKSGEMKNLIPSLIPGRVRPRTRRINRSTKGAVAVMKTTLPEELTPEIVKDYAAFYNPNLNAICNIIDDMVVLIRRFLSSFVRADEHHKNCTNVNFEMVNFLQIHGTNLWFNQDWSIIQFEGLGLLNINECYLLRDEKLNTSKAELHNTFCL